MAVKIDGNERHVSGGCGDDAAVLAFQMIPDGIPPTSFVRIGRYGPRAPAVFPKCLPRTIGLELLIGERPTEKPVSYAAKEEVVKVSWRVSLGIPGFALALLSC